ncbi:MAG: hypothetical protein ACTH2U_17590 [Brevibacterium sp.]
MADETDEPIALRMFPDYAHSVLWLYDPLRYERIGLSPVLADDLDRWEQSYYDSLTADFEWIDPNAPRQLDEEGEVLGRRVAEEFGNDFTVEVSSFRLDRKRLYRSSTAAANPEAAAVVKLIDAEWDNWSKVPAEERQSSKWSVFFPRSGRTADTGL